jgi:tetratricopeptide (TPR) repeat protein
MPEIAEAQALLAALAQTEPVREALEKRQARAKMHVDYARAVQWAKGWGSEEARAAVERAHELSAPTPVHPDYWSLAYGPFAVALLRGEFHAALEIAETYLRQAQVEGRPDHAVNARRLLGTVKLELGAFSESRREFEKLLEDWDEDRDKGLQAETGADVLCVGWAYMAQLMVTLGEVDDAVRMSDGAIRRAESLGDFGSLAFASGLSLFVLAMCGRTEATLRRAEAFEAHASEKGARLWQSIAREWASWARGLINGDAAGAATELRDILAARRERQERQSAYMGHGLLAQLQGKAGASDAALASIADGLSLAEPTGGHRADSFLYRVRGDVLAERNPVAAEAAYREALRIAQGQGARTFELQAAHALAKLHQYTGRPADAHAVIAPALEGFSPTPEMPEIAEAQALLVALAEVKADAARRQQRQRLHVAYGNALIAARGIGAPETTEAFARAREGALGDKDGPERLAVHYGLWAGSSVRGDLAEMRAHAEAFLNDVEARPDSPEAGVAHRAAGLTCWFAGDYREARDQLQRALILFEPGRDDDLAFRFGLDPGVAAMGWLAIVSWPLGDVDRAISLIDRMQTRMANITHVGTLANGRMYAALFELLRGDRARVAPNTLELVRLAQEYDLKLWRAFGVFLEGWASTASGASGSRLEGMRRGVELLREQNVLWFDGLLKMALAEAEAQVGDPGRAVAVLDETLVTCDRTGYRAFEAELHRARGEMLQKRDPANPAPAEEAFLTAIAVSRQQAARSFELRAALSLAKLYQSSAQPTDAHAALAPALEGFSPTLEMPEIAEAQALLTALAATDEVKAEAAQRQRLTQLHVSYGNALIAARGYGAPETTEAFARARQSTAGEKDAPGRLSADYDLWVGSFTRGELPSMRAHSSDLLNDVAARPDSPEAGVAHRVAGATCWFAGDYREARNHLERALALFQPGRDDDMAFRFGQDQGVSAMAYLALALWPLGEIDRAASFMSRVLVRMASLTHGNTIALGHMFAAQFALMHGGPVRGRANSLELARIASAHDLTQFRAFGMFFDGWTRVETDLLGGLDGMRRGVDSLRAQNILIFDGSVKIALAKTEAEAGDPGRAVAILDDALATADRVVHRAFEAELHRARGELLLKRDPANPTSAEEDFLTALAIAKRQGTRSFELRAALVLAKLYQSTARLTEAHAVLSPVLDGFAPTREFPEIAEAQEMVATIEAGPHL